MNDDTTQDDASPELAAAAIAEALEFLSKEADAAGLRETAGLIRRARDEATVEVAGAAADRTGRGTQ